MATYLIVNTVFLITVMALLRISVRKPSRVWLFTLFVLLALTAVFDSLIVGFGIVGYDTSKISGIYVGMAPVEDFFYALLAAIVIPTLWKSIGGKK